MDSRKKAIKVLIVFFVILILLSIAVYLLIISRNSNNNVNTDEGNTTVSKMDNKKKPTTLETSDEIEIVPTLLDKVKANSAWCATFQLVWNDMQNEVVKKDIVFNPQIEMVENLNKQSFKEEDISDKYYYKKFGLKTLNLKAEIEKGIKDKFNETSDVLDLLDWNSVPQDDSGYTTDEKLYIFYAMLFREFNFEKEFSELDKSTFKGEEKEYNNIEYFGIEEESSEKLYSQVNVLYYNSDEDYAVSLETKEGDLVVLGKGVEGDTYQELYNNIQKSSDDYDGKQYFTSNDTLKVPNIKFNLLKEYEELENETFYNYKNDECTIQKALQTIKFELNKKGGKIKSEAVIEMKEVSSALEPEVEYRNFNFDSTFTMFLVEDGKDKPYFASTIDDITLFQK